MRKRAFARLLVVVVALVLVAVACGDDDAESVVDPTDTRTETEADGDPDDTDAGEAPEPEPAAEQVEPPEPTPPPEGTEPSDPGEPATETDEDPPDVPNQITLDIVDGQLVGGVREESVPLGDEVTLVVTGNTDDEVHVHGYDHHIPLVDGAGELTFTAEIPGIFEVELEDVGRLLIRMEVS